MLWGLWAVVTSLTFFAFAEKMVDGADQTFSEEIFSIESFAKAQNKEDFSGSSMQFSLNTIS